MSEREKLEQAMAHLETQRTALGDAVVDAMIAAARKEMAALEQAETPKPALEGERKLVTVMFADISGFTALSEKLDPEAVRELMNACFDRLVPVVEKYEGTVDKFIGDEIMAVFGAPVAHENDPERALRTALEMMDVLAAFNADHDINLDMHIGINTGLVIAGGIGSEGRQQYSVMGDAVNLAARLEDASERGEIFVGPETYRLTAPLFEFEPLEPIRVKGKAKLVAVHRLLAVKAVRGKVRGIDGLRSAMVGRDTELQQLQAAIHALQEGKGSAIAIIGEAGLGKSRLVAEVRQASPAKVSWVEGCAFSYTRGMSYWIARDVLRGLLGVKVDASPEEISTALRSSIESILPERGSEDAWPYLAHLLDLPLDTTVANRIAQLSPQALQERILRAFSSYVRARSQQPLVLMWEDMHWADISSLNLLESLLSLADEVPLLFLLVFRPEKGATWDFHQRVSETRAEKYQVIELHPLTRDHSASLVQSLLKIENLPDQTRALILDKAEGNPLFLEELLRSLIEAGMVLLQEGWAIATDTIYGLKAIDVPNTVQGVIAARIDRLPANDKYALQTAAVIGRVFQRKVLEYLLDQEQASVHLDASLDELQRHEFVRLREALAGERAAQDQEYIFKHVLTQETAYHSLLIVQRKALHRVAGEAIEALFPERLEELAATLAYHFERAEVPDKAIAFLRQAGERAARLSAYEEAIAHLTRGLELLKTLPDAPDRIRQELDLLLALGPALTAIMGCGAPEVEQTYSRARELIQEVGETQQFFPVLWGLYAVHLAWAEHQTTRGLAEQLLALARQDGDLTLLMLAHCAVGVSLYYLGEFVSARAHMEEVITLYDPKQHRSLALHYGVGDIGVFNLCHYALALWKLGYPDQALEQIHEALALARETSHPFSMGWALGFAGNIYQMRGEMRAVRDYAEAAIVYATEQGFPDWLALGTVHRGWALAQNGQEEEGVVQMHQGLADWRATGVVLALPYLLALLCEGYGKAGQGEEGLDLLVEALATAERTGEGCWAAELHRLKGEFLLMQGEAETDVETHYRQALDISYRQGAKAYQLRSATSLSRLWKKQGKKEEARKLLAEIYGWFTEGFDTLDLVEARAVLEELS